MDAGASWELESIKMELDSIITELSNISWGIDQGFENAGNKECAIRLNDMIELCRTVKRKLNGIDTTLTESFARAHGVDI